MSRKRPCRECGRWFEPNKRAGTRQRTCARDACQKARHRRACSRWHAGHPGYDRERRLRERVRGEVVGDAQWRQNKSHSPKKNDARAYARRALKRLKQWRALTADQGVAAPHRRGLTPLHHHKSTALLWGAQERFTEDELVELMYDFVPFFDQSFSTHGAVPYCSAVRSSSHHHREWGSNKPA